MGLWLVPVGLLCYYLGSLSLVIYVALPSDLLGAYWADTSVKL